jgi:hypothetical protein
MNKAKQIKQRQSKHVAAQDKTIKNIEAPLCSVLASVIVIIIKQKEVSYEKVLI